MDSRNPQAVGEARPDAGGTEAAHHRPLLVDPGFFEAEDLLHGDDVLLHADDLRQAGHASRPVGVARHLNHQIDGGGHLLFHGPGRKLESCHRHHRLESCQSVPGGIGVNGGERAVVAGVHGLQHVDGFAAAHLPHHDAVGAHSEAVDHQLALGNLSLPLDIGGPGLQAHHVLLPELQLRRIFNGHDPLVVGDEGGQHVEKGRFPGAGASGDQDVEPRLHAPHQQLQHGGGERAVADQVLSRQGVLAEFPDGQMRAVDGEGRNDGVDAGAIR